MALDRTKIEVAVSPAIDRIEKTRKEKGLTRKHLSKASIKKFGKEDGLSEGGISQLFSGKIVFKKHHAKLFSELLGISYEELCSLIQSPMTHEADTLEALKDTLRFLFRKANGKIGSFPPPPVPEDDPQKAAKIYSSFYRQLEDEGYDML